MYPSPVKSSHLLPATLNPLANALVYLYHNNCIALQWEFFSKAVSSRFIYTPEMLGKFALRLVFPH